MVKCEYGDVLCCVYTYLEWKIEVIVIDHAMHTYICSSCRTGQ